MSYNFTTPCCNHQLRIEDNLGGRKLQCPHCNSKFYIPENLNKKKYTKISLILCTIAIVAATFLFPSKAINKAKEEANQLYIITTKARAMLIQSTTLKMEESTKVTNALEIFLQAEKLIEQHKYKEAIPFFELALEKLTAVQQTYSHIKSTIQPEITSLKKRIKKLKNQTDFLKAVSIIEKYKNDLKPKEAQSLINILKQELTKAETKKPRTTPTKPTYNPKPPQKKTAVPKPSVKPSAETIELKIEPKKEKPQEVQQEAIIEEPKKETKELKISEHETYYGEVVNDIPNGQGRYSFSNGNSYDGNWLDGKFHGKGSYSFNNGDSFTGEWKNNLREGIGSYKWKDQSSLKALWKNNQAEGRAFYLVPNKPKKQLYFTQGRVTKLTNKTFNFQSPDVSNSKFRLTQKQQRIYDFSRKLHFALNKLQLKDSKLFTPDLPPHIFTHQRYFSGLMSERDMQEAEFAMKQDFFSVKRYILTSNKSLSPEEENGSIVGDLDGYSIPTAKLGVVLDTSGSMLKYIKPLKEQITQTFPSAAFIEVESCRLTTFNTGEISEKAADDSTMNAIKYLIENKGVDSIYWFSDLNGTRAPEAMSQLNQWLDENLVTFYVRSVGKKPDKELISLIKASGGKYLKK